MHLRAPVPLLTVVVLAGGIAARPLRAQAADSVALRPAASETLATPRAGRVPLFRRRDEVLLGSAIAAAVVVGQFDGHVALESQEARQRAMRHVSAIGTTLGGPVPFAFSAALYELGRATGRDHWTLLGRQTTEALLLSGAGTAVLKGVVGRSRPFAAVDNANVLHPGRGFGNHARSSFPSGHTSAAFAVATVLTSGTRGSSTRTRIAVSTLALSGATFVGVSRVYTNQHWASDVIAGAALGITSGLAVVPHNGLTLGITVR